MAILSIERLGNRYGRRRAVDGVSFEVNEREVVGLLGPNGSGKTTILRILTGYLRPSEGTVRIDGFDVVRDGHQARCLEALLTFATFSYFTHHSGKDTTSVRHHHPLHLSGAP